MPLAVSYRKCAAFVLLTHDWTPDRCLRFCTTGDWVFGGMESLSDKQVQFKVVQLTGPRFHTTLLNVSDNVNARNYVGSTPRFALLFHPVQPLVFKLTGIGRWRSLALY